MAAVRSTVVAALVMHMPAHNRQRATEIGLIWFNLNHVNGLYPSNQPARLLLAQVSHGTVPTSHASLRDRDGDPRKGRLCGFDATVSHYSTRLEKSRGGHDGGCASHSREKATRAVPIAVFPPYR